MLFDIDALCADCRREADKTKNLETFSICQSCKESIESQASQGEEA